MRAVPWSDRPQVALQVEQRVLICLSGGFKSRAPYQLPSGAVVNMPGAAAAFGAMGRRHAGRRRIGTGERMANQRDVVRQLHEALRDRGRRMNDWTQAQRRIREVLPQEVGACPDIAEDHGLAVGDDGLSLQLADGAHVLALSFRALPSGNVEVIYRSPYLPLGQDGTRPTEAVLAVEAAAVLRDPNRVDRYVTAFFERATAELCSERAELRPLA